MRCSNLALSFQFNIQRPHTMLMDHYVATFNVCNWVGSCVAATSECWEKAEVIFGPNTL